MAKITDTQLALLGDRAAQERVTERGELLPCPGCNERIFMVIRCTKTKAEIVCQRKDCGFRIAKNCKEGASFALLKAKRAWNTRAPAKSYEALSVDWAKWRLRAKRAERCIAEIEDALTFGRYSAAMLRISEYRGKKEE